MEINKELSQQLSEQTIVSSEADGHQRWYRAFLGLRYLADARYVEGWGVLQDSFSVFEHAWLEYAGEIIDPVCWQIKVTYFPGLRFNALEARSTMAQRNQLPLAYRPHAGQGSSPANSDAPAYWAAWEEALKFAEAQKRGLLWRQWRRWQDLVAERLNIPI